MDREKIVEWFMSGTFCVVLVLIMFITAKLAFDIWTAPNIFIKKEEVVAPAANTDEVCVKWLFQSNLDGAKKRICGR